MEHKQDNPLDYDKTVSASRQESIMKALELAQTAVNGQEAPIHRPDINLGKVLFRNFICFIFVAGVYLAAYLLGLSVEHAALLAILSAFALTVIHARKIIISCVLVYQRYAPERVRASCVFEPTCSQYMILAVEKYGPIKGVAKGIGRLFRCHPPNSGFDYP